ncbi:hypothetical protein Q1695_009505 [Nippostrongylus brasiliensis]|nr:hypothetical protein Q1695_009505 [Nippostrongylus brasiliensis]
MILWMSLPRRAGRSEREQFIHSTSCTLRCRQWWWLDHLRHSEDCCCPLVVPSAACSRTSLFYSFKNSPAVLLDEVLGTRHKNEDGSTRIIFLCYLYIRYRTRFDM